jgi:hypothetical protein
MMSNRIKLACAVMIMLVTIGASNCSDPQTTPHAARGATPNASPSASAASPTPPGTPTSAATLAATTLPSQVATAPAQETSTATGAVDAIEFLNVPAAEAGQDVTVRIRYMPNVACQLTYTFDVGVGGNSDIHAKNETTATDAQGRATWTWTLDLHTKFGTDYVYVVCRHTWARTTLTVLRAGSPTPSANSDDVYPTPEVTSDSDSQLLKLLGAVDELPDFWILGNPNPSDSSSSPYLELPVCEGAETDPSEYNSTSAYAEVQFINGVTIGAPVLNEFIASVGADAAIAGMESARNSLSCPSITDSSSDGTVQWAVEDQAFPALGDDVYARRLIGTSDDGWAPVHLEVVIIRDDGYFVMLMQFGFADLEPDVVENQAINIMQRVDARTRSGS